MLFEIITTVRDWLHRIDLPTEVLTDREDSLRVIFETEKALAELIVAGTDFAPCRFVSFAVLDPRLDLNAAPVFCFYDDETCSLEDILRALDQGVQTIKSM